MPRDLVLGTAGHIDHGKTALVKALTGIDCDRLPEEKKRGITIDIGFAHLKLGDWQLGIVDVPGHERFIKNMLAGATGIDLALLVVAADDSVMPQTREHVEILSLLGLRHGVIALTKCDLVDETTRGVVELEVRDLVQSTFLKDAPIICTSAHDGAGLSELKTAIAVVCGKVDEKSADEWFRMAIDRSFVVQGHGTVVTGSVTSGRARVDEELEWLPSRQKVRVRSLQNHGKTVDEIHRGMRAAINLAGVRHEDVVRGQELAAPGYLLPSRVLTARLHCLTDMKRPVKHRMPVRLHVGTAEVMATVSLLDCDSVQPGQWGLAQLFLADRITAVWGQPFVLRDSLATQTLGGGQILQPVTRKIRRRHLERIDWIGRLWDSDAEPRVLATSWLAGWEGVSIPRLVRNSGIGPQQAQGLLDECLACGHLLQVGEGPIGAGRLVHADVIRSLEERILQVLKHLHERFPLIPAHERQKVRVELGTAENEVLIEFAIGRLLQRRLLVGDQRRVARSDYKPRLGGGLLKLKERILSTYKEARMKPPKPSVFAGVAGNHADSLDELFRLCVAERHLVHLSDDFFLHRDAEAEMRQLITRHLANGARMRMFEIRDLLKSGRQHALAICDYLDRLGITRREGDFRMLAKCRP